MPNSTSRQRTARALIVNHASFIKRFNDSSRHSVSTTPSMSRATHSPDALNKTHLEILSAVMYKTRIVEHIPLVGTKLTHLRIRLASTVPIHLTIHSAIARKSNDSDTTIDICNGETVTANNFTIYSTHPFVLVAPASRSCRPWSPSNLVNGHTISQATTPVRTRTSQF
jgi:hypothetical protein